MILKTGNARRPGMSERHTWQPGRAVPQPPMLPFLVFASHSIAKATARMFCGTTGKRISSSNLVAYWFGCKPSGVSNVGSG